MIENFLQSNVILPDNLDQDEKKALKLLSEDYSNHTESDIKTKIKNRDFKEINYD